VKDYKQQLMECHERIAPYVHRTPVMTSRLLDQQAGAQLFFKCENFQRMGAFKMRGATNAILSLSESDRAKGVVTHSSGNMAQAVSLAAQSVGVPAFIVMPENAPQVKKDAVRDYGGQIFEVESTIQARKAKAAEIANNTGASFVHPSNQIEVILGQGTAGLELIQDQPNLDFLLTPIGGGGLVAGCGLAARYFGNGCKCIGGEPMACDDAFRSLASGKIESNASTATVADGLRTVLGDVNFPIIQECVEQIIRVEEEEIVESMRLVWERMKIIIEPSCAVPFAAARRERDSFSGKKVGIVLSGGNVDLGNLPF
jgi:threonine dehydratase